MPNDTKVGRPKKAQTKPLIFEHARSRVTRQVSMSAKTADDLSRYVAWAAGAAGADEQDAMTLTMDQALGQFFQRDKLFKESANDQTDAGAVTSPNSLTPSAPPPAAKAALPPALVTPRVGGAA